MGKTELLPPSTAVQITWACTGTFSKDKDLRLSPFLFDKAMNDMKSLLKDREKELKKKMNEGKKDTEIEDKKKVEIDEEKGKIKDEMKYLTRAMIAMNSCLRTLHTMYKGRELNFEENTKLRDAYLESLKENIDFGNKLRDILKSLPTMTLGAAGTISVSQTSIGEFIRKSLVNIGLSPEISLEVSPTEVGIIDWVFLGILVASGLAIGYIFNDLLVRWSRKRKQMLYVINDYERNIYYDRYIRQVETSLESLYRELNQIHEEIFKEPYDKEESRKKEETNEEKERENNSMIEDLIGAKPERCKYFNQHMREKKITPGEWTICETGWKDDSERCPHWKYEESNNIIKGEKSEISEKNQMSKFRMDWYRIKTLFGRFWYLRLDY